MSLVKIVDAIESDLARFYAFDLAANARDHLVSRSELLRAVGPGATELPEWHARAAIWLTDRDTRGELFIGLNVAEELVQRLSDVDPLMALDDRNLDAFCTIVEEVSHFHLIANRAREERGVSKLELEWQGEIDKLVMCALLLARQTGDAHILPLARKLYDGAEILETVDQDLYWQATRHAARFWFAVARNERFLSPSVRNALQLAYETPWPNKMATLAALRDTRRSA